MDRGTEGDPGVGVDTEAATATADHDTAAMAHVRRPLDAAAGEDVSVHTPAGAIVVERGPVASIRLSTTAPTEAVGIDSRRAGGLQLAVERAVGVDAPVDVHLELPAGVALAAASTGDGDVTVRGVDGSPAIESGAGDVSLAGTEGIDTVRTNDGDATVAATALRGDGVVEVVEGDIRLALASGVDATLDIVTRDGDITTAPTFDSVAVDDPQRFRGTLGDGDAWLTAKTDVGDVAVELSD